MSGKTTSIEERNMNHKIMMDEKNRRIYENEVLTLELRVRKNKAEEALQGYTFDYLRDGLVKSLILIQMKIEPLKSLPMLKSFNEIKDGFLKDFRIEAKEYDKLLEDQRNFEKKKAKDDSIPPATTGSNKK